MTFHGSYDADDVTFLLVPKAIEPMDTIERERLMQSGERHYSELLPDEQPPDEAYMALFREAMVRNAPRMGRELVHLADILTREIGQEITLVSLARAGTPVGVLLARLLRRSGAAVAHYSVSIIRDRGLDAVAMAHILERHAPGTIVFVDGWTGKGAIRATLTEALRALNADKDIAIPDRLAVLADLAGVADYAATYDDYVIPSSVLNAVVSGLISRTVLNAEIQASGGFHACRYYEEWRALDVSRQFVDHVMEHALKAHDDAPRLSDTEAFGEEVSVKRAACVKEAMERFGVEAWHRVKPGAGEATRAVLRRTPDRVLVRSLDDPEVSHLKHLCEEKGIPVETWPDMAYRAMTIIRPVE